MSSELRVNTSTNRVGLGTITYTDTGPIISGITTGNNFKTGTTNVHSTGVELANINTGGGTATFGGGLTVTGNATFNGNGNVLAGNYLDVQDNKKLRLGTDGDCAFYFNGAATLIETGNKIIHMQTDASIRLQQNSPQQHMLIANAGGSVDLYCAGTKRFETSPGGTITTGISTVTGVIDAQGYINLSLIHI